MKNFSILLFSILLFSGCATTGTSSYYTSVNIVEKNMKYRDKTIINDFLYFLSGYYPPAKTTFYLSINDSETAIDFSKILEENFRSVGYGLTTLYNKENCIPFAWKIDKLTSSIIRVTFNIGKSNISRLYKTTNGVFKSVSPYTVRGLPPIPPYDNIKKRKGVVYE